MESHTSLLSDYELPEIKIVSNSDEKASNDSPFVFSATFWGDPSLVSVKTINVSASS